MGISGAPSVASATWPGNTGRASYGFRRESCLDCAKRSRRVGKATDGWCARAVDIVHSTAILQDLFKLTLLPGNAYWLVFGYKSSFAKLV